MKITVLVHAYVGHGRNAGGETTLHDILKGCVARGASVDVVLDQKTAYTQITDVDGVTVHPYQEWDNGKFNVLCRDTDIVLSHLDCSERATYVAEYSHRPMVHLVHNTFWQTEGYLAMGCDLAIYNSEWVAAHHAKANDPVAIVPETMPPPMTGVSRTATFNFKARKALGWPYVVVHPPIDPTRYECTPGKHVTMVNLWENKGPDVFYALADRFPDVQFLGVRGGYADKHQDIRVRDNVTIVPNSNDFRNILMNTSILLMPSRYESFGRVAIEAGAAGIPTIASPTEGLLEALGEGGTYASNPVEWDAQLKKLLTPSGYTKASKHAKARSAYWASQVEPEMDALWAALNNL